MDPNTKSNLAILASVVVPILIKLADVLLAMLKGKSRRERFRDNVIPVEPRPDERHPSEGYKVNPNYLRRSKTRAGWFEAPGLGYVKFSPEGLQQVIDNHQWLQVRNHSAAQDFEATYAVVKAVPAP